MFSVDSDYMGCPIENGYYGVSSEQAPCFVNIVSNGSENSLHLVPGTNLVSSPDSTFVLVSSYPSAEAFPASSYVPADMSQYFEAYWSAPSNNSNSSPCSSNALSCYQNTSLGIHSATASPASMPSHLVNTPGNTVASTSSHPAALHALHDRAAPNNYVFSESGCTYPCNTSMEEFCHVLNPSLFGFFGDCIHPEFNEDARKNIHSIPKAKDVQCASTMSNPHSSITPCTNLESKEQKVACLRTMSILNTLQQNWTEVGQATPAESDWKNDFVVVEKLHSVDANVEATGQAHGSMKKKVKGSPGRPPTSKGLMICSLCQAKETAQWRYIDGMYRVCNRCFMKHRKRRNRTCNGMARSLPTRPNEIIDHLSEKRCFAQSCALHVHRDHCCTLAELATCRSDLLLLDKELDSSLSSENSVVSSAIALDRKRKRSESTDAVTDVLKKDLYAPFEHFPHSEELNKVGNIEALRKKRGRPRKAINTALVAPAVAVGTACNNNAGPRLCDTFSEMNTVSIFNSSVYKESKSSRIPHGHWNPPQCSASLDPNDLSLDRAEYDGTQKCMECKKGLDFKFEGDTAGSNEVGGGVSSKSMHINKSDMLSSNSTARCCRDNEVAKAEATLSKVSFKSELHQESEMVKVKAEEDGHTAVWLSRTNERPSSPCIPFEDALEAHHATASMDVAPLPRSFTLSAKDATFRLHESGARPNLGSTVFFVAASNAFLKDGEVAHVTDDCCKYVNALNGSEHCHYSYTSREDPVVPLGLVSLSLENSASLLHTDEAPPTRPYFGSVNYNVAMSFLPHENCSAISGTLQDNDGHKRSVVAEEVSSNAFVDTALAVPRDIDDLPSLEKIQQHDFMHYEPQLPLQHEEVTQDVPDTASTGVPAAPVSSEVSNMVNTAYFNNHLNYRIQDCPQYGTSSEMNKEGRCPSHSSNRASPIDAPWRLSASPYLLFEPYDFSIGFDSTSVIQDGEDGSYVPHDTRAGADATGVVSNYYSPYDAAVVDHVKSSANELPISRHLNIFAQPEISCSRRYNYRVASSLATLPERQSSVFCVESEDSMENPVYLSDLSYFQLPNRLEMFGGCDGVSLSCSS